MSCDPATQEEQPKPTTITDDHRDRAGEVLVKHARQFGELPTEDWNLLVELYAQAIADAEVRGAATAIAALPAITVVVAEPPGPTSQFIEVEDDGGRGVRVGEWTTAANGWGRLRVTGADLAQLAAGRH